MESFIAVDRRKSKRKDNVPECNIRLRLEGWKALNKMEKYGWDEQCCEAAEKTSPFETMFTFNLGYKEVLSIASAVLKEIEKLVRQPDEKFSPEVVPNKELLTEVIEAGRGVCYSLRHLGFTRFHIPTTAIPIDLAKAHCRRQIRGQIGLDLHCVQNRQSGSDRTNDTWKDVLHQSSISKT
jgi:hypothetical protein